MNYKNLKSALILLTLMGVYSQASAEITVIVHPSNEQALDKKTIERIYMGKSHQLKPYLVEDEKVKEAFLSEIVNKTKTQFKAHWSRLTFTGKGFPPKSISTDELVNIISTTPDTIGIIDSENLPSNVKTVPIM